MLVLLSFGLVLVATVLLVLGLLVGDGLALIYISIGLSALAAVILFVAVRVSKPRTAPIGLASGPAAVPSTPTVAPQPDREYAAVAPVVEPTTTMPAAPPVIAEPAAPAAATEGDEWLAADQEWEEPVADWDEELEFPIADYDELTVDEILPLLPQLYTDEIDVVEARERRGQNRAPIIDELQRLRAAASGAEVAPLTEAAEPTSFAPEPESVAAVFPIEDYEQLMVEEITPLLDELDSTELQTVRDHEIGHQNRSVLVREIDRRLAPEAVSAPAESTPVVAAVETLPEPIEVPTAKKAEPKKAAPKKAPVTKATTAKKAAPRTTAAKKAAAPGRSAPAPATKTAAKTAAKKGAVPARKAAAKKEAAPAKKASAKKAAAPAKKATAKKTAAPTKRAAKKTEG